MSIVDTLIRGKIGSKRRIWPDVGDSCVTSAKRTEAFERLGVRKRPPFESNDGELQEGGESLQAQEPRFKRRS